MGQIDEMDPIYYIKVLAYNAKKTRKTDEKAEPQRACIDEVWPMM